MPACSAALLCAAVAGQARAQSIAAPSEASAEPDSAALLLAETLYREGRRLAAEQRYEEAIAKLSESYRIDPGVGTLLALAVCHEATGQLATAWVEFGDAMRAAQRDKREDRVQLAREHLNQIEPKLSRLTIAVAAQDQPAGLELRLDGVRIGAAALNVAVPIDPGPHRIDATAPGKVSFSQEVNIGAIADQRVVVIPALKDVPVAAAPPPMAPAPPAPAPAAPSAESRPVPTSVYVAGTATLAFLGAAIGTGVAYNESWDQCNTTGDHCSSAKRVGWINIGLSAATLVSAGVTVYLYATRPRAGAGATQVGFWSDRDSLGLRYVRSF